MSRDVLNIGHRGASGIPENTIPSFEKALEQGADGFELDVRLTGDGKLVVVHGAVVGHNAVQVNDYEKIRKLPRGHYVPLFEEVLKKFGKSAFLDVEFKSPGFEEQAVELLRKHVDPARTLVSAFEPRTLVKVHELFSEVQLGFIYNRTQDEESRHNCPIDYVIPQFRLASRGLIEEIHSEGLKVIPWTVNETKEMKRLLDLGVDGLISDHPDKVSQVLAKHSG